MKSFPFSVFGSGSQKLTGRRVTGKLRRFQDAWHASAAREAQLSCTALCLGGGSGGSSGIVLGELSGVNVLVLWVVLLSLTIATTL